jgi:transposase
LEAGLQRPQPLGGRPRKLSRSLLPSRRRGCATAAPSLSDRQTALNSCRRAFRSALALLQAISAAARLGVVVKPRRCNGALLLLLLLLCERILVKVSGGPPQRRKHITVTIVNVAGAARRTAGGCRRSVMVVVHGGMAVPGTVTLSDNRTSRRVCAASALAAAARS